MKTRMMNVKNSEPISKEKRDSFAGDQALIAQLKSIGYAIVHTFGTAVCEAIIHDFRNPERSIIWIEGNVTNRKVGGSMSQIGIGMMSEGDEAKDKINYTTKTRDGKILKSCTVALRDADDRVFGAFCVNLDVTNLATLANALNNFLEDGESEVLSNIHFGNNVAELVQVMIDEAIVETGLVNIPQTTDQRVQLVEALDQRGFFSVRSSVPLLADYLGVSRTSIYNYINQVEDGSLDGKADGVTDLSY